MGNWTMENPKKSLQKLEKIAWECYNKSKEEEVKHEVNQHDQ